MFFLFYSWNEIVKIVRLKKGMGLKEAGGRGRGWGCVAWSTLASSESFLLHFLFVALDLQTPVIQLRKSRLMHYKYY